MASSRKTRAPARKSGKNEKGGSSRSKVSKKGGQENEVPTVGKKIAKDKKKAPGVAHDGRKIYNNCKQYHCLKVEVLAPFVTKLLLKHRFDEWMEEDLDDEMTINDSRLTTSRKSGSSMRNSRREITLGMITEDQDEEGGEDGNDSTASHEDDWRKDDDDSRSGNDDSDEESR